VRVAFLLDKSAKPFHRALAAENIGSVCMPENPGNEADATTQQHNSKFVCC
jgi:hypothetical protein